MKSREDKEVLLRRLEELYGKKHALLAKMLELTSARAGLDEADLAEEILDLVEARQAGMEEVDAVDAEIMKIDNLLSRTEGEGCPDKPAGERLAVREAVGDLRQQCLRLVEEMQEMDRLQMPKLQSQLAKLGELREKLGTGRRTLNAYRAGVSDPGGVFVDKKR